MKPLPNPSGLETGSGSHAGMSGKHNEDSVGLFAWRIDDGRTLTLGIVADGIGGQAAGERASRVAVDTVQAYFNRLTDPGQIPGHLQEAIAAANRAVYQASRESDDLQGMGTTMAVAAVVDQRLFTAYVGDSRIYRLRDGQLQQLTIDHTWAQEAIEAGLLTPEQAKTHPNRNVIKQYLGSADDVSADLRLRLVENQTRADMVANQGVRLQPGDTILICSDGLTDMIDDEAVRATLLAQPDLQPAVDTLIDKANAAGGRDNITVVILRLPGKAPAAVPSVAPAAPAAASPASGSSTRFGLPLLLLGGLGLGALALVLLVGAFLLFRGRGDDGTPTQQPGVLQEPNGDGSDPAGAPATVGVRDVTVGANGEATLDPLATPTRRAPDARDTSTPTFTPPAPPPPNTATSTPGPAPTSDGDAGGTLPTATIPPTATSPPDDTPTPANSPTPEETPTEEASPPVPPNPNPSVVPGPPGDSSGNGNGP